MDTCPKCGTSLFVKEGKYYTEGTDIYLEQYKVCLNDSISTQDGNIKKCDMYNQVVETIKHKLN